MRTRGGRPRLRLVAAPRRRRFPFLLMACLLVGAGVFGVVSLQALVSQSSFRIQQLNDQNAQLQQRDDQLQLQVAQLSSPDRMQSEARRLGLQPPEQLVTITVKVPAPPDGRARGELAAGTKVAARGTP